MRKKKKTYAVILNGKFLMNTTAVSSDKAINNVRYRIYQEEGNWYNVPDFDEFDAVEL